jgi:hypothetical protein
MGQAVRGEPEDQEGDADAAGEGESRPQASRLPGGHGDHAQRQGRGCEKARGIAPRNGRLLIGTPEHHQRRHVAHGEQWRHREENCHPEAHPQTGDDGRPSQLSAHAHGEKVREQTGQQELQGRSEGGTHQAAQKPQGHGLEQVRGEERPRARSQAAQDGDRLELSLDEDVNCAGHADAAEKQRDQGHEPEKPAQPGQGLVQVLPIVRDRAQHHALGGQPGAIALGQALRVGSRRQLDEGLVPGPGAEDEQSRLGQVTRRNEHARPQGRARADVARGVHDRSADLEARLAERQRVADACIERGQQRGIDQGPAIVGQVGPLGGRVRLHHPVEGVAAVDRRDLHEARARARGHVGHGGESRDSRQPGAGSAL